MSVFCIHFNRAITKITLPWTIYYNYIEQRTVHLYSSEINLVITIDYKNHRNAFPT